MEQGALGVLARATTVEIGRLHEDGVLIGASALLMTRELGLSLAGVPPDDEIDDDRDAAGLDEAGIPA